MRRIFFSTGFVVLYAATISAHSVHAEPRPAVSRTAPSYSVKGSKLSELLDNPTTKDILTKYIPKIVGNPQIVMARSITLVALQPYTNGALTTETLNKIDVELSKVPPPKTK